MGTSLTWRDWFTQPRIFATAVAPADRTRGLATMVGPDGMGLHAWDVPAGSTRPVPTPPANLFAYRWLSADGRHAYVLADQGGNELRHLTAVDLLGDAPPVDLTPALDPYTVRGVGVSRGGAGLVLTAVTAGGFQIHHLPDPAVPDESPRQLARFRHEAWTCLLSADGQVATVDITEHNPGVRRFAVRALRVADGQPLGTLTDGDGSSVEAKLFSPHPGEATVAVTTDSSGVRRPLLWHIGEDARRPLHVDRYDGDVVPVDWSDDGRYLLLVHVWRAAQRLLRYDLATDRCEVLDVLRGSCHDDVLRTSHFGPDGEVLAATETLTTPLTVYRRRSPWSGTRVGTRPAGTSASRNSGWTSPSNACGTANVWRCTHDSPPPGRRRARWPTRSGSGSSG